MFCEHVVSPAIHKKGIIHTYLQTMRTVLCGMHMLCVRSSVTITVIQERYIENLCLLHNVNVTLQIAYIMVYCTYYRYTLPQERYESVVL